MSAVTVHFEGVGRGRMSWAAELQEPLTERKIVREIKRKRALGSRDIDVVWPEDDRPGAIYVGMFRRVGSFTLERSP